MPFLQRIKHLNSRLPDGRSPLSSTKKGYTKKTSRAQRAAGGAGSSDDYIIKTLEGIVSLVTGCLAPDGWSDGWQIKKKRKKNGFQLRKPGRQFGVVRAWLRKMRLTTNNGLNKAGKLRTSDIPGGFFPPTTRRSVLCSGGGFRPAQNSQVQTR